MSVTFAHGYALLIGVGNCKVKRFSLPVAANDMRAMQRLLTMPDLCAYPETNVHLLSDETATRRKILDELMWLKQCAKQDPDATCIIFYSGHGNYDLASGAFWLVPHDYYPNQPKTRLNADDFQSAISAIAAKRLLVFIDSCHAGGMASPKDGTHANTPPGSPPPEALIASLAQGEGRVVFASSSQGEKSYYQPDRTLSIYTKHLLEALQGAGNKPGDTEVRVGHLMSHLSAQVTKSAFGLWQVSQTPYFKFETQDFPVAVLRGGKGLPPGGWAEVASETQNTIRIITFSLFGSLDDLETRLREFKDALARVTLEAEFAQRQGGVKDSSFAMIRAAWDFCRRDPYIKLNAVAPQTIRVSPLLLEYWLVVEKGVKAVNVAISKKRLGEITSKIEDLDFRVREFEARVGIALREFSQAAATSK